MRHVFYKKECHIHPGPALQTSLIFSLLTHCANLNMLPIKWIILWVLITLVITYLMGWLGIWNYDSATRAPNTHAHVPPAPQAQQSIQRQQLPPNSQQPQSQQQDEQCTDISEQLPDQTDAATANVGSDKAGQDNTAGSSEGGQSGSQT